MPEYFYPIPAQCLPIYSDEDEIEAYRLGRSGISELQDDFTPQLNDPKSSRRSVVRDNPCKYCGVSMLTTRELALETQRLCLKNRDKLVRVKIVCEKHGPVKHAADNSRVSGRHINWYQFRNASPADIILETEII